MNLIQQIKEKIDLKTYIGQKTGLTWKPAGTSARLETCPFCNHKDCFTLHPSKTFYNCFSCQNGGDVVKFKSLMDNTDYRTALNKLCEESGIKQVKSNNLEWQLLKNKINDIFIENLFTDTTKYKWRDNSYTPLEYLLYYRGHSMDAINYFSLGFTGQGLVEKLKIMGYGMDMLKAINFVGEKDGKTYCYVPDNVFSYPFPLNEQIDYYRFRNPNKPKQFQLPLGARSKEALYYNQDILKYSKDMVIVEGEDDVISVWDAGCDAIAICGALTKPQVQLLSSFNLESLYLCFDGDEAGKIDTEKFVKMYNNENVLIINCPAGQDINDILRIETNKKEAFEKLKNTADTPKPEDFTKIRIKPNGYYIVRTQKDKLVEEQITNWTFTHYANCITTNEDQEQELFWTGKFRIDGIEYERTFNSKSFSSTRNLRELIISIPPKILYFTGQDEELSELIRYISKVSNPKTIIESDRVGETDYGFLADNMLIQKDGSILERKNGGININETTSIRPKAFILKGKNTSELPIFSLIEPVGGLLQYKKKVFDLLIKSRDFKVFLPLGWIKSTIWSNQFFDLEGFFPLMVIHGKTSTGKTTFINLIMSMLGLKNCNPIAIVKGGSTNTGIGRKFAYYASLPVFVDEYADTEEGRVFDAFFKSIFNRESHSKALKAEWGNRQVVIRGCLLLAGENVPYQQGLQNRTITVEFTRDEMNKDQFRKIKPYKPDLSAIGLDWIKNRHLTFATFYKEYQECVKILDEEFDDSRQAEVYAVALASAITENIWDRQKLIDYTIGMCKSESIERKQEELMSIIWQAVVTLEKNKVLTYEEIIFDINDKEVRISLNALLDKLRGNQYTRHYSIPRLREVVKMLKQEHYFKEVGAVRVNGKIEWRWVLNLEKCPDTLKSLQDNNKLIHSATASYTGGGF